MLSKTSLLAAYAAANEWNYQNNGSDWPDLVIENNECGGPNQSPVDLTSRAKKQLFK